MTLNQDAPAPVGYLGDDPTVGALREVIFGPDTSLQAKIREVVFRLGDIPPQDLTDAQEAGVAPELLCMFLDEYGLPAHEIAQDAYLRGALCDWAQIAAPRMLPVLTGHLDLAVGAILALGNGSAYQQACLSELDSGAALGVLMLTELGGTNGADQLTTATWDPGADGFWLHTPSGAAAKFMPNVADARVAKTVVVTARLLVDGRDEGVLPFLLRLRDTTTGLAEGADVVGLPDKLGAPMDHALIRFDQTFVPRDGLLGGGWARITDEGRFECGLARRMRFHTAIASLGNGRLDLANAAVASARAGLAGLVNYSRQRRPGPRGKLMADRDAVQRDLASAAAAVYVTSVLGRRIRDMAGSRTQAPTVLSMLAKPLLTSTAYQVLTICRHRAGAQGVLRTNRLVDWIANIDGMITAEGENQIMQITAGRAGSALVALRLDDTPADLPWWVDMITDHERALAMSIYLTSSPSQDQYEPEETALGRDCAAIELAHTTAVRLAVTATLTAAQATTDPGAADLATSAAAAFALDYINTRATWYAANDQLPPQRAGEIHNELRRHLRFLADELPALTAAFDIPPLPGAPLFAEDYLQEWVNWAGWDETTFSAGQ
ncbi:acyl-CoA dehydrogenase family protein [Nocardia carnea]|uniref:acyl-CoA dehydrogenase family protein n=1 Tax=Nocardia carnea TaxID=37328 RepID=UPI002455A330|nr:acyl-CoA dehydrogenase family protein [Nocardia carnea]